MSWGVDRVMELEPVETLIWLVVPVSVAAAGEPAVDPMTSCPSVRAIQVGAPEELAVKTALAVVVRSEIALVPEA